MHVKELLNLIPEECLTAFAIETNVDHQVKKLNGQVMFQLFLFSILNSERVSLRVMEEILRTSSFRTLSRTKETEAKYNSISDRLAMINSEYFEKIFHFVYDKFSKYLNEEKEIDRYDSTMVAISSKLLDWGMHVGQKKKNKERPEQLQIKFTVGMHGSLPSHLDVFFEQSDLAEDVAMKKAVLNDKKNRGNTIVFDRGLFKRKTFEDFTNNDIWFVTRANTNADYDLISKNKIGKKPATASLTVFEDLNVTFPKTKKYGNQKIFRLVKARLDNSKEEIFFISNINEMSAYEIAATYKRRWDIEPLFKFLKQDLNIGHLVSRNLNGIKVMMYMSLIASILLITYRKLNKISGNKIAKLRFNFELENLVIGQIVAFCGGDIDKFNEIYGP